MSGAAANVLLLKKRLDKRQREVLVEAFKVGYSDNINIILFYIKIM